MKKITTTRELLNKYAGYSDVELLRQETNKIDLSVYMRIGFWTINEILAVLAVRKDLKDMNCTYVKYDEGKKRFTY